MKKIDKKTKNALFIVFNLVLSLMTMTLMLFVITRMLDNDSNNVALFIGLALISQTLHQVLLYLIYTNKKDRLRILVVGCIYVVAAIFGFMARNNYVFFYLSTFLVTMALAANQILTIFKEKDKKGIITNILMSVVLIGLGVAVLFAMNEKESVYIPLVSAILLLFISVRRILAPSLKYEKMKLLVNIMVKTHTFDALICLLAFIIAFSFMFPMVETKITTFWDAMWYCFTVITTIGFGDFYAESVVGRILTVILGIYGIVVVAILTSVVVNFYNEVSAKEKDKPDDYLDLY
ncbi:MAG: two pore domain potassium channel family protein [Acholeplasmatales bacterium]|nr:two pore domain potassium channel family protein [Acholeplasmatales bacterium]